MVSTRWQHQKLRQSFKSVCDAADGGGGDLVEPCWEDDDVTVTSSDDDDGSSPMTRKLPGFSPLNQRHRLTLKYLVLLRVLVRERKFSFSWNKKKTNLKIKSRINDH